MTQCDKILAILQDGQWHSTKELMNETKIWYPPRRLYDLKQKGYLIETRHSKLCEEYRLISKENKSEQSIPVLNPKEAEQKELFSCMKKENKDEKKKKVLKELNSVIQVCSCCGKVDVFKSDGHDCFQYIQNQEAQEYYD